MTREELKRHCLKLIESCERWARLSGQEPYGKIYEEHKLILELLEQKPKTGHWIRWYERREYDSHVECIPHCKCSECGKEYDPYSSQFIKYCNECGAKMQQVEE